MKDWVFVLNSGDVLKMEPFGGKFPPAYPVCCIYISLFAMRLAFSPLVLPPPVCAPSLPLCLLISSHCFPQFHVILFGCYPFNFPRLPACTLYFFLFRPFGWACAFPPSHFLLAFMCTFPFVMFLIRRKSLKVALTFFLP